MDAVVLDVLAVQAALVPEVLLELLVDVVGDRFPAKAETQEDVQAQRQRPPTSGKAALLQSHVTIRCC